MFHWQAEGNSTCGMPSCLGHTTFDSGVLLTRGEDVETILVWIVPSLYLAGLGVEKPTLDAILDGSYHFLPHVLLAEGGGEMATVDAILVGLYHC